MYGLVYLLFFKYIKLLGLIFVYFFAFDGKLILFSSEISYVKVKLIPSS